jgi:hypothetical protein
MELRKFSGYLLFSSQPIGAFIYLFVGRLLISNLRRKKSEQTGPIYPSYQQGYQPLQQPIHNHQEYEQHQHSSRPQYDQPEVTYPETPQMHDSIE